MFENVNLKIIRESIYTKIVSTAVLFASYTWWLYNRSAGDRIIALIVAFTAFIPVCIFSPIDSTNNDDKLLFEKFCNTYDYNKWGIFLENHCFGQSFSGEKLEVIDDILHEWMPNPLFHFVNQKIENEHLNFINALKKFRVKLSSEIHLIPSTPGTSYYRIPKPEPWSREGEIEYEKSYKMIDEFADKAITAYKQWVLVAKNELKS